MTLALPPLAQLSARTRSVEQHTVDIAAATRDVERARPERAPAPVSRPAPPPEAVPIRQPDSNLSLAGNRPAPAASPDMPPPPEANVVDRAQTTVLAATATLPRSAAGDLPPAENLPEPAVTENEPEREASMKSSPFLIAKTPETDASSEGVESRDSADNSTPEPETDLLAVSPGPRSASSSLLDVEEPPLPSEEPPAATHDDDGPATRTASLVNREKDLVRTITTAVKRGDSEGTSAADTVKAVASQWFDEGKAPKVAAIKAAAREVLADRMPDLPLDSTSDLLPRQPESMPDRMPKFNAPATGKIDIQSDRQADYDQANNRVTFTGKVELNSSSLRLRADRVEVSMKKDGGMDVIHATGNVLMRTQDSASSTGQIASAGSATYDVKSGEIVLSDWPKIQESGKALISTDPSTRMYLYTDGRLRTEGPNRTIIGR